MFPRSISRAFIAPAFVAGALLISAGPAFAAPQSLAADLTGSNEVGGGIAGLTGTATVTVDPSTGQVCARVTSNVTGAVAIHIHKGATGVNGPVAVALDVKSINGNRSCVSATAALAKQISADPAGFYVNIHTPAKPGGALRGQLTVAPSGANAGSGGQAGTGSDPSAPLVALMLAGAGLVGVAGWRLVRR